MGSSGSSINNCNVPLMGDVKEARITWERKLLCPMAACIRTVSMKEGSFDLTLLMHSPLTGIASVARWRQREDVDHLSFGRRQTLSSNVLLENPSCICLPADLVVLRSDLH